MRISPLARTALDSFVADVPKIAPANYALQGYRFNRAVFLPTAQRVGQAVAGEMSADDALKRLAADIDEQVKAAWGKLDFVVHAIAYSDKEELKGKYLDTTRANFLNSMDISVFSFTENAISASRRTPSSVKSRPLACQPRFRK